MGLEKRGMQSDSLPRKTDRQRERGNDISFLDALKENYKEFINQYLELRQQL